MVRIESRGFLWRRWRLISDLVLTPGQFRAVCTALRKKPFRAQKTARVRARQAHTAEQVVTHWNGVETVNTAQAGDWIVTSLDERGHTLRDAAGMSNVYVVKAEAFARLYAANGNAAPTDDPADAIYDATTEVMALYLSAGFEIRAPWGEMQRADKGYLMLGDGEVYGNNKTTFEATYRRIR